ncbi:hypothetical protein [Nocardioides campestrisoli]|uniref:hypothetical protein n=1 Tax=Nocardioides campestrisoli TaxID=2736757 RepID=UPI0015E687F4|nr:hypothetical protein [Nocardioides campestrisoli]
MRPRRPWSWTTLQAPARKPVSLLAATLLTTTLLAGCSADRDVAAQGVASGETEGTDSPSPTSTAPSIPASKPTRRIRTPEQVVQDPDSSLSAAWVVRDGKRFLVNAWWRQVSRPREESVVSSTDGFTTATYSRFRWRAFYDWFPAPTPPGSRPDLSELTGLLQSPAHTSVARIRAVIGGGDGATLFPFEAVARSKDHGMTWQRFDVPRFDGEMGYVSGQAVLPDGRLLVLLQSFSGDRLDMPSSRHHGLWVSLGDDWSSYEPLRPRFTPQVATRRGDGSFTGNYLFNNLGASPGDGGVVWAATWDDRLYVSTDGAASFREIPAR